MKIIVSRLAPRHYCINLFGTVWTRDASWIDERVVRHERIHSAQQRELLWLPFYILYVMEWFVLLLRLRDSRRAYRAISFEREAYGHDADPAYLQRRRHYAQWRSE